MSTSQANQHTTITPIELANEFRSAKGSRPNLDSAEIDAILVGLHARDMKLSEIITNKDDLLVMFKELYEPNYNTCGADFVVGYKFLLKLFTKLKSHLLTENTANQALWLEDFNARSFIAYEELKEAFMTNKIVIIEPLIDHDQDNNIYYTQCEILFTELLLKLNNPGTAERESKQIEKSFDLILRMMNSDFDAYKILLKKLAGPLNPCTPIVARLINRVKLPDSEDPKKQMALSNFTIFAKK